MPIRIDPISYSSFYRTSSHLFRSLLLWQCPSTEQKILLSVGGWRSPKHSVKVAMDSPGTASCQCLLFRQPSSSVIQTYGWELKIPKTKSTERYDCSAPRVVPSSGPASSPPEEGRRTGTRLASRHKHRLPPGPILRYPPGGRAESLCGLQWIFLLPELGHA